MDDFIILSQQDLRAAMRFGDYVEAVAEGFRLLAEGRSSMRDFGLDGASLGSGQRVYASIQAEPPRMIVFGAFSSPCCKSTWFLSFPAAYHLDISAIASE